MSGVVLRTEKSPQKTLNSANQLFSAKNNLKNVLSINPSKLINKQQLYNVENAFVGNELDGIEKISQNRVKLQKKIAKPKKT
jgi:hypothetical protein